MRFVLAARSAARCIPIAALSVSCTTMGVLLYAMHRGVALRIEDISIHALVSFLTAMALGLLLRSEADRRTMAATNRQFRAIVDALRDCLNLKDSEGRFLAANPATARLMGATDADTLIGKTDADICPLDEARQFRRDEEAALACGQAVAIEQRGTWGDGTAGWLSTLKVPAYDHTGTSSASSRPIATSARKRRCSWSLNASSLISIRH